MVEATGHPAAGIRHAMLCFEHARHGPLLAFSNPATTAGRFDMTLKLSRDEGRTWPVEHHLRYDQRPCYGYSCLTRIDDEHLGTQRLVLVSEVREGAEAEVETLGQEVRRRVFATLQVQVGDVVLVPRGTLRKTSSGKRRHRRGRELYQENRLDDVRIAEVSRV